ncbi:MAG: hypothetical protein MJ105_05035 [Lachnospiraceae bacterium]|nr:hypothetical protein [Lachnospiraceae bacterium]
MEQYLSFEKYMGEMPAGSLGAVLCMEKKFIIFQMETASMRGANTLTGESVENCKTYMDQSSFDYGLFLWKELDEERLFFVSKNKDIRALEFLDFLMAEFALVKGNGNIAFCQISTAIFKVQMANEESSGVLGYVQRNLHRYYAECEWISAVEYCKTHKEEVVKRPLYEKKKKPWSFVKSTDIVPEGKRFLLKTLENTSGIMIAAEVDKYIMIGCKGEVYDISREKFDKTYMSSTEGLDVFHQMMEYIPAAEEEETGEYIPIDEMARLCYPRGGSGIYAIPLANRTKVFRKESGEDYDLGVPGDYLAVREDDLEDVYIIKKEVFEMTYTLKN